MKIIPAATIVLLSFIKAISSRKLVFVQAIWRHGDRAPLTLPYPKDPYKEDSWPRGWGELTNIGIGQLSELGSYFRKTYRESFVAEDYLPGEVYMRASDSDRALASAQSFLFGFYPASGRFKWENGNSWQPIPVHANSPGLPDMLCKPTAISCPVHKKMVKEDDKKNAEIYNIRYKHFFDFLANATGIANFSYDKVNGIYDIHREIFHNLTSKQPSWVNRRWPRYGDQSTMEIITELRRTRMIALFNSPQKSKLIGGYLLNNWIENAVGASNGTVKPKRMLWYSSHDGTVLALLYAMGAGNDMMVPYASAVIMEVYENGNQFEVEVLYRNNTSRPPYKVLLPNCGTPCTVPKMVEIYKDMVVTSYEEMMKLCGKLEKPHNGAKEFPLQLLLVNMINIYILTNLLFY